MKTLHIPLEDKEYEALLKAKKEQTWHDFLISIAQKINGYAIEIEQKKSK